MEKEIQKWCRVISIYLLYIMVYPVFVEGRHWFYFAVWVVGALCIGIGFGIGSKGD